ASAAAAAFLSATAAAAPPATPTSSAARPRPNASTSPSAPSAPASRLKANEETNVLTFKVLSLLLRYPTPEIHAALTELHAPLEREGILPPERRRELGALIEELAA